MNKLNVAVGAFILLATSTVASAHGSIIAKTFGGHESSLIDGRDDSGAAEISEAVDDGNRSEIEISF